MEIRKDIPLALYYQLKEEIRRRIVSKEWQDGSKIPAEKEICDMFGVSRATARKALDELQSEGYLNKIQGKGTYVQYSPIGQKLHKFYSFSRELKEQGRVEQARIIEFKKTFPDSWTAQKLQLDADEEIFMIKRIRYIDDRAYTVEHSYIPVKYVEDLTEDMIVHNGLYNSLEFLGVYPKHAVETFGAVNLVEEEALEIGREVHEAAISLVRVTYSGSDIVEVCRSVVAGDVFQYTVELK